MDAVVYLALFVLTAVFIVSLVVLVFMCRRRRMQLSHLNSSHLRFSKLRNENLDSLVQLTPLLANALDRNGWVYDVGGILQHCVAVLKLSHSLSENLAGISLANASPQLQEIVCEATHRIMPRFDDLLISVASPKMDVRILEARATALATVSWSLLMPFSLVNPKCTEILGEPLRAMNAHLEALKAAADLAERADAGKIEVDWRRVDEQIKIEDTTTTVLSSGQTTPQQTTVTSVMNAVVTAAPPTDNEEQALVEKSPVQKESEPVVNGNGNGHHPVDPSG